MKRVGVEGHLRKAPATGQFLGGNYQRLHNSRTFGARTQSIEYLGIRL
jgi:hypothetical protein